MRCRPFVVLVPVVAFLASGCSSVTVGHGQRAILPPASHAQLIALLPTVKDGPGGNWTAFPDHTESIDARNSDLADCVGSHDTVPDRLNEVAGDTFYRGAQSYVAFAYSYAAHTSVESDHAIVTSPKFIDCLRQEVYDNSDPALQSNIVVATTKAGTAGKSNIRAVTVELTINFVRTEDKKQHVAYFTDVFLFGDRVDAELDLYGDDVPTPMALRTELVAALADRIALAP